MFKRILIANRGEIAVRVIRACKEMGIETVSIYSVADKDELHVSLSDYSVCVGGNQAADSYLNMDNIIQACINMSCDAIHPGYGFLSENIDFVKKCEENNITFIGPKSSSLEKLGDKSIAKITMKENNIPVVQGSDGAIKNYEELRAVCARIGYPVLIKASNGGGGRGMRRVYKEEDLKINYETAKKEAMTCFGSDDVYVEQFIENPRHIEFQVLADQYGNTIHLYDRDCSIQRKNQKLLEESPSTFLNDELREEMGKIAVRVAQACQYENAGTVEFILDYNRNYYFMEMNTRIQVEHPVTEMVVGIDLVKEQIRIASGLPLSYKQEDVKLNGHAIEIRVNAEDVLNEFMPSAGVANFIFAPGGFNTRFDSLLFNGCKISPFYDSMIAKIIVKGETRLEAIRKMRRAIEETIIEGVKTNIGFQYAILHDKDFLKSNYSTSFLEEKKAHLVELYRKADLNDK